MSEWCHVRHDSPLMLPKFEISRLVSRGRKEDHHLFCGGIPTRLCQVEGEVEMIHIRTMLVRDFIAYLYDFILGLLATLAKLRVLG